MQYTHFGTTDLKVSRICFGTWQLNDKWWGGIALRPWQDALRKALELGVNFVDTADGYGDGYAESCLGDFLATEGLRDRFIIATKFFFNLDQPERYPDTRYESIVKACEASLRRLRTDHVDLYQIHAWDALTRPDEVAAALGRLKQEGKIRWVGVSNLTVDQIQAYRQYIDVVSLQASYSLLARGVEASELPFCLQYRAGFMAYSPLYRGLLSGKYKRDQTFTQQRAETPLFKGKAYQRVLDGIDELRPIAEDLNLTIPQLAVRWVLTQPAVTCAIVGIRIPEHIEGIVAAADEDLAPQTWHRVADIMSAATKQEEA